MQNQTSNDISSMASDVLEGINNKREVVKQSRKQRRANKTHRNRLMRKIRKKVRAVKAMRAGDALPIEAEV